MDKESVAFELSKAGHMPILWAATPRLWPRVRVAVLSWLCLMALFFVIALRSKENAQFWIMREVACIAALIITVGLGVLVWYRAGTSYILTKEHALAYHALAPCKPHIDSMHVNMMDDLTTEMDEHGYGTIVFSRSTPAWGFRSFQCVEGIPRVHATLVASGVGASSSPRARAIRLFRTGEQYDSTTCAIPLVDAQLADFDDDCIPTQY